MRGAIELLPETPKLDAESIRVLLYGILTTEQQKRFELDRQIDLTYSVPGVARFRLNVFMERETLAAAFRVVPHELKTLEELGLPESLADADQASARPRRRDRPDRLG